MLLFLLVFISIYGLVNSYALWRVHQAFPKMGAWLLLPAGFLLLMVAGPVLVQVLARAGLLSVSRALSAVVYPWMAVILWIFMFGLAMDLWNLAVRGVRLAAPSVPEMLLSPRTSLCLLGVIVAVLGAWSLWEAAHIRVERVTLRTNRLAPGATPVKIGLISDLHMSLLASPRRAEHAARLLTEAKPDLVIAAGDLIDVPLPRDGHVEEQLASVHAPLGKFAVFGNHEYYTDSTVGPGTSERFLGASGFRVLRGEIAEAGPMTLVGVDDPAEYRTGTHTPDDRALLAGRPADAARGYTILVKHRPTIAPGLEDKFDLQLSGHTHGGQIFPFDFLVRMQFPRYRGLYELERGAMLYVSRGTGTWGPPMRLFAPPEVTLITIEPAEQPPAK